MATQAEITQVRMEIIPWLKNSYKPPPQPWWGRASDSENAYYTVQQNKLQGYIDILQKLKVSVFSVYLDVDDPGAYAGVASFLDGRARRGWR